MDRIEMMLPYEPKPKLRPRFGVRRNRVITHTPEATKQFESSVGGYYAAVNKGFMFPKGTPLKASIEFGMRIPESASKKRSNEMLSGNIQHTVKPDLDNLTKAVLDALNGVAWYDDAQIIELSVSKRYIHSPSIYIIIEPKNQD